MTFLCEHHRRQILAQPATAPHYWRHWMNRGTALIEAADWQSARQYLGNSFDLADALLQADGDAGDDALGHINRYMISGHHLAECLGRCGDTERELHYLLSVHQRLVAWVQSRAPQYWLLGQHLHISRIMLNRYRRAHGSFAGYYACCVEAEWYIKQCSH